MNLKWLGITTLTATSISIGMTIKSIIDEFREARIEKKIAREAQLTRDHVTMNYLDLMDHNNQLIDELIKRNGG